MHARSEDHKIIPKSYSDLSIGAFNKTPGSTVLPQVSVDTNVTTAPLIAGD